MPESFKAMFVLNTFQEASRKLPNQPVIILEDGKEFHPFPITSAYHGSPCLSVLEFRKVAGGESISKENPIRIYGDVIAGKRVVLRWLV